VGIDLSKRVSDNTLQLLQDPKEIEAMRFPEFIKKMLEKGFLGNKTKQGFYKKSKGESGNVKLVINPDTLEYVELTNERIDLVEKVKRMAVKEKYAELMYSDCIESKFLWDVTKNLLLDCADRIPEITDDYKTIDEAMKYGYNWELGPFELWELIGVERSVRKMMEEGDNVAEWVLQKVASGESFYDSKTMTTPYISLQNNAYPVLLQSEGGSLFDIGDDVLCFQFASKANSLTPEVSEIWDKGINLMETSEYKGMVIKNNGPNFCVGANLQFIHHLATEKKWEELEESITTLQNLCMKIKYAAKPIVMAPHGMTLGGGLELCLHASQVVPHVETYMGLVEAGVGLVASGGGTKELLFRKMKGNEGVLPRANIKGLQEVFENVAMAKTSTNAWDAKTRGFLLEQDRIIMNPDYQIDEAKRTVTYLYDCGFTKRIPFTIAATGTSGLAALKTGLIVFEMSNYISEYDKLVGEKYANILCGGRVLPGTILTEQYVLELERESFMSLCGENKTLQRIEHMLKTGKPLRN
jgi:3-hydroxyacyl-CoA dehydrogenase